MHHLLILHAERALLRCILFLPVKINCDDTTRLRQ
jgi:hypothetical protein